MNSKTLIIIAGLCSGVLGTAIAQSGGGSGGAGGSGGSAGAGAGSGSGASGTGAAGSSGSATGSSGSTGSAAGTTGSSTGGTGSGATVGISGTTTSGTAGGSNIGAPSTGGVPNMAPTNSSRSAIDAANAPVHSDATLGPDGSRLPAGLSVAPARSGVSPISGLPASEVPGVSPGTAPIDAQGVSNANNVTGERPTSVAAERARARAGVNDISTAGTTAAVAPIGMGTTTVVPTPPPAPRSETAARAPSSNPNHVWVDGHYTYTSGQWTWNDGGYQRPPSPGATWTPGTYDAQTHRWTEGHWSPGAAAPASREGRDTTAPRR